MDEPVGIDLGTTFSCVACFRNEKVEIIPDRRGRRLVPSMVYVDPKTGKISVGNNAYDLSTECPENLLRGRKYNIHIVSVRMKYDRNGVGNRRGS